MSKKDLQKLKNDLYWETRTQRNNAWSEKDFKKAEKIRKKEREYFKKWEFVKGLLNAQEKEQENDKTKTIKNERKQ